MKRVLITGGTGYVGSHACVEMLQAGYEVVVLDNLANSKRSVLDRIEQITGQRVEFIQGDVRDRAVLDRVFRTRPVTAVIHFAGLKAVSESIAQPLAYYDNNVHGSMTLCEAMTAHSVKILVFSSSATVYGDPRAVPIREDFSLGAMNPYGRSKIMVEEILRDLAASDATLRIALLRYFNPAGAHVSGLIGEDPNGVPGNLVPYISRVAAGRLECLSIFGNDYSTSDGTGVRDYIHVMDLAQGHVAALRYLEEHTGVLTLNLGTGRGYSVLEMVRAFERAAGCTVAYRFAARRSGDIPASYADPSLAWERLGWRAQRGIDAMCEDTWRWQQWATAHLI